MAFENISKGEFKIEWRDVSTHVGRYIVSNTGIVKSLDKTVKFKDGRTRTFAGKELKGTITVGYFFVGLHNDKIRRVVPIHRLVAEAFIPNPENKRTINHKDGNKLNNNVFNLEWNTDSENIEHAYCNGLNNRNIPILQLDLNGNIIAEYRSSYEASKITGFSQGNISTTCNSTSKYTCGYYWIKKNEIEQLLKQIKK